MRAIIEVLAMGKGHEEVVLPEDPKEAKIKVDEMLQKRYTLLLSIEGTEKKVTGFDGDKGEYIVSETKAIEERFPFAGTKVTAVAPTAGG